MAYHLILSRPLDADAITREVAAGLRPEHVLVDLARRMDMGVHAPRAEALTRGDRVRAKLCGRPEYWALARRLAREIPDGDVALCNGEDVGIPLAVMAGHRIRVAAFVHNLDRPRMRVALRALGWGGRVALWMTPCDHQATFLRQRVGVAAEVEVIPDRTDVSFFHPRARPEATPRRPVIASVGLEGRDYRTLASATGDMPVDVRISGFSADAQAIRNAFPEALPPNMTRRFYEWPELAELYRSADVVVVSLFERTYAAGVTTFLEGMASGKPIIISDTVGMRGYIHDARQQGVEVATVAVGDAPAMRGAIERLLSDRLLAEETGLEGRWHIERHHASPLWLERVEKALRSLSGEPAAPRHVPTAAPQTAGPG